MSNPYALLLLRHPIFLPCFVEISERALEKSGFIVQSIGGSDDYERVKKELEPPDIIVVDWGFPPEPRYTSKRFANIRPALSPDVKIIAFSTTRHAESEVKAEGADAFAWAELKFSSDDPRYITGNAEILKNNLEPHFSYFKIKASASAGEVRRFGNLKMRSAPPDRYKDFSGFNQPARYTPPAERYSGSIVMGEAASFPSANVQTTRRFRRSRNSMHDGYLAVLAARMEARRLAAEAATPETGESLAPGPEKTELSAGRLAIKTALKNRINRFKR